MAPSHSIHVAICGGGIAGLCTAIGLLRRNVSCTIYEAASAFEEIGAGVSFGPNALRAMKLIDPDIYKGYQRCETSNSWPEKRNVWFDFRIGQSTWKAIDAPAPVGKYVVGVKAGDSGQSSVHRAHFLDELVKLVPAHIAKFGKRLKELDERNEKVVLTFEDGTTAEADAVIGCDGIKSKTRKILLGEHHGAASAIFSGKYAYRGLIPMDKAVNAIGEELAKNSQIYMGHHGHVLTFPIEKGSTMNVVAFKRKADGEWNNDKWVLPVKREEMIEDFSAWGENVQRIISLMENPDVWALFDHPPAPTYYSSRLCLVGDAAHASTPHQGAGAGQAIEDAFILSNLLSQVTAPEDVSLAFKAYDEVRRPRTQKVVVTSRDVSELYELENPEIEFDLEKTKEALLRFYDWLWYEDLSKQLETAERVLRGIREPKI